MSPDELAQVKRVVEDAIRRDPADRIAFINVILKGDPLLCAAALEMLQRRGGKDGAATQPDRRPADQQPTAPLVHNQKLGVPQLPTEPVFNFDSRVGDSPGGTRQALDEERFFPGQIVSGRYRIVSILGRGGMGEVYRADDLTLGITVALKFLRPIKGQDDAWQRRFLDEVRIARQVTHPNVVRVFDVGEANGDTYLSMEYVDGETLDSLSARINRLPEAKANQLSQELCAGLAAIHDAGILHRDLKPTNVMIDGRGRLRLTDFGLASRGELGHSAVAAGTPGYIAPESIAGRETTVRSDVYSLGLVLYELYTGSAAYPGSKNTNLLAMQSTQDPVPPSVVAPEIDPKIERVILQCLEREPRLRPGSARHVAAMLPGGSPLAAALAAGETPSPEMVAAAGRKGRLPTITAVLGLVFVAIALAGAVILKSHASLIGRVSLPKSGEVLAERAREIVTQLGYPATGQRERYSFDVYEELLLEIIDKDDSASRWERLSRPRPAAIDFWYRRFPNPVRTQGALGRVSWEDPPQQEPGMVSVRLSPAGQLRELAVIDENTFGPEKPSGDQTQSDRSVIEPDWSIALRAADLDNAFLHRVEPERVPQVYADCRAAWEGVYPESPDVHIRVEAAGFRGRLVALRLIEEQFPRASGPSAPADLWIHGRPWAGWLIDALNLAVLVGTLVLARHNLRNRRGDRLGARRVGLWIFGLSLVSLVCMSNSFYAPSGQPPPLVMQVGAAMLDGAWFWLAYLGVEPYLRRLWPESIISWTRLLSGRWRDPMVGSHILAGVALGAIAVAVISIDQLAPEWVGEPARAPLAAPELTAAALAGPRSALGAVLSTASNSLRAGMIFLLLMIGLRLIVRRPALASVAFVVLQTAAWSSNLTNTPITWLLIGSLTTLLAVATIRFGLLTLVSAVFVYVVLMEMPITTDPGSWYAGVSAFAVAIPLLMASYGATVAISMRGEQRLRLPSRGQPEMSRL